MKHCKDFIKAAETNSSPTCTYDVMGAVPEHNFGNMLAWAYGVVLDAKICTPVQVR